MNVPRWPICPVGNSLVPTMMMYFHFTYVEYILFKEWVTTSEFEFIIAVFIIFLFSVGYEFLKLWRFSVDRNMRKDLMHEIMLVNNMKKKKEEDILCCLYWNHLFY
jgi:hypothetical protein